MSDFQPQQKILNFLDEYIKSDAFQKAILQLREEIGIPSTGLNISENDLTQLLDSKMRFLRVAIGIVSTENRKEVKLRLRKIEESFPVSSMDITFAFEIYFYYNKYLRKLFEDALFIDNVCKIVPARSDMIEYCADDPEINEIYIAHQENLTAKYPIALYISQDATQRDVVAYVQQVWDLFIHYSKEYKDKGSKVGKIKRKKSSIKERNDFIYQNRHLPRKKIMELITDTFGADKTVDYGYIGKIISVEKKKRKDV